MDHNSPLEPEAQQRPSNVRALQSMILETTNFCNLKCPMCIGSVRKTSNDFNPYVLSDKAYKRVKTELFPYLEEINFSATGEPFLDKKLTARIRDADTYGIKVSITTNGTLLSEDLAEEIIRGNVRNLYISFDGATKETYERIRRGASFELVVENIKRLLSLRQLHRKTLPLVALGFVAMRSNVHELPLMVRLAKRIGVDHLNVSFMVALTPEFDEEILVKHKELTNRYFLEAINVAKEMEFSLGIPPLFTRDSTKFEERTETEGWVAQHIYEPKCDFPWTFCMVLASGDVVPCCACGLVMGNVNESSMFDILNSERYQKFREDAARGTNEFCNRCTIHCSAEEVDEARFKSNRPL